MKKKTHLKVLHGLIAIAFLAIYLFPIYWQIITSLKSNIEIFQNPPTFWPTVVYLENYAKILIVDGPSIFHAFGNSLKIALGTTLFSLVFALPAAYALAKFKIKFATGIMFLFIIGQMLSPTVKLVPLYLMFNDMHLLDTHAAVVIALSTYTIPFTILILRPYFLSIPSSITESALIDGCSKFSALVKIMLPMSYPGIAVATIFNFLAGWNDLIYPFTLLTKAEDRSMIANMYNYMGEYSTQWNYLMIFAVMSVMPVIILFFCLQKYIVGGITMGAVKG